ncbi:conserved hypothetical protein [Thermoplasma acidophilum]|uniref:Extradiol ring-cleavage dioxygenase class III enzyme subunit B domain-containing protein n=1 Tax=Thermoplasma acidophilum (strain ATCC 25905 / DSM 1728 / JCM 9062 / NBRC 15155 / AMRC-C165) TaxID=273075 RepID=Q9HIC1_THEAC|nr:hypothetical protein [Thermoplasma acidophilum]CAC12540.1 conserved hypothetical protein [Thermoplasma acidophilum]
MLNRIYVIPHGDEILDRETREDQAMYDAIKRYTSGDDSDTFVVISPHGIVLDSYIAVTYSKIITGYYRTKKHVIRKRYENAVDLVDMLASHETVQRLRCITLSGNYPCFLDFGSLIPLAFFRPKRIVAMGEPRLLSKERIESFSDHLVSVCENYTGRISLIISADQAHTHSPDGPYGYSDMSSYYDETVVKSIDSGDFSALYRMQQAVIDEAKPDSYQNMIMLKRILERTGRRMKVRYYYVAKYFGMAFASESENEK